MTQLPPPKPDYKVMKTAEEIDKEREEKEKSAPLKDSSGRVIKAAEVKEDTVAKDSYGRVIKEAKPAEKPKEVKMIQDGSMQKRIAEEEGDKLVKHQSFENYIVEQKKKCKDKHLPHQKCQDCTMTQGFSYKVNKNCKEQHRPYPQGMCNKCLPPAVVLTRQSYRHVDYVSFMNFKEMSQFVGAWQQTGCYEQRMGYLYGYYSEDPNFPDGVRVNVEAIYEPPQLGELNGVQPLDDPLRSKVDMISESLSLERVGYIFTTLNKDKVFMTSQQLRQSADLQQQHLV
jgi:hypothetical protein